LIASSGTKVSTGWLECFSFGQEVNMKATAWSSAALALALANAAAQAQVNPTDPQPTCTMCPGTYISLAELESYTKKAVAEKLVDQQVRDIDIGKANVGIGMVHRGKLDKPAPNSVAEHDQISEVYQCRESAHLVTWGLVLTGQDVAGPGVQAAFMAGLMAAATLDSGLWREMAR
jgi:hypothetical protein